MNGPRKQRGYLGPAGKRFIGSLSGNEAQANFVRGLNPAAWFRRGDWVTTGSGVAIWNDAMGTENYLGLPGIVGNYASTPDSAANSITGDIDIRVRVALDDWTPSAVQLLVCKDSGSGGLAARSYDFYINTTGKLGCEFSVNGSTPITVASTNACSFHDGAVGWVRVTRAASTGEIAYWESSDGAVWTSLGGGVGTSGSLFDNAEEVRVGLYGSAVNTLPLAGKIYRAIIKNGIDGTTVVDFNAADAAIGATSFASSTTGETWTVNSSSTALGASIRRGNSLLQGVDGARPQGQADGSIITNGSDEFLRTAAMTLSQPTWVIAAVGGKTWTLNDVLWDGVSAGTGALQQTTGTPEVTISAGSSVAANNGMTVGAIKVVSALYNGASSSLRVGNAAATTGNAGAGNMGGLTVGAIGGGAAAWGHAQYYEIALFPFAPSAAQEDRVIRYMAGVSGAAL